MVHETTRHVGDEERREFLKVVGATGAVAVGGATLGDVRDAVSAETGAELAAVGEAIRSDLAGSLDASLLGSRRGEFTDAAAALPAVVDRGLPEDGRRQEFEPVADAGRPIYDHLGTVGFFGSTTTRLPEFTPGYIEDSVKRFASGGALAAPLTDLGFTESELVDLLATVTAHRERIGDRHWVSTDELPRDRMEIGEYVPPMTKAAAGGALLWLGDLDEHLWKHHVLLTDDVLADAVWHARTMAAGFQLMTEGAKAIAAESGRFSNDELAALLSSGFALQAIGQNRLPQDAYWITEEMRAERRTDLQPSLRY